MRIEKLGQGKQVRVHPRFYIYQEILLRNSEQGFAVMHGTTANRFMLLCTCTLYH